MKRVILFIISLCILSISFASEDVRICTMEYAPVCGIDGVTYGNTCMAGDVEIVYQGECSTDLVCTEEYAPVCGTNGITYENTCKAGINSIAYTGACLVGGDLDEHGCKGSAGYGWDETWNACVRPWEIEEEKAAYTFAQENSITVTKTYPEFRSTDTITREEAAAMFVRLAENVYKKTAGTCSVVFSDSSNISSSFKSLVNTVCAHNIMVGNKGYFMPKDTLSQGQALAIIMRIIESSFTDNSAIFGTKSLTEAQNMGALSDTSVSFDKPVTRGQLIQWIYEIHSQKEKSDNYTKLQNELNQAEKKWSDNELTTYTLTQRLSCFCIPNATLPYEYKVINGVIDEASIVMKNPDNIEIMEGDFRPTFHTISEVFEMIQKAIDEKADSIDVAYDENLGYPTTLNIDRSFMIADEEQYYTFSLQK